MSTPRQQLGKEILDFLAKHAKLSAHDDPDVKYNSPDGSEMECAAELLLNDKVPLQSIDTPHSSWASGGYKPENDSNAKLWHDTLKSKVRQLTGK